MLPFMQHLSAFCNRVNLVVLNLVQQLGSIYSPRPASQAIDIKNVHLDVVFKSLGDALAILATLDELIAANPVLLDHWTLYKRMMKSVRANTDTFGVDPDKLPAFERWVLQLEGQLLDGLILQNCIEQVCVCACVSVCLAAVCVCVRACARVATPMSCLDPPSSGAFQSSRILSQHPNLDSVVYYNWHSVAHSV
jgi:WASH complex subunit 7